MRRGIASLRRLLRARQKSGIAALEFALLAPTFVLAFAGVVDIGSALLTWMRLEAALSVGTSYALTNHNQVNSTNGATLAANIATLVTTSNGGTQANATVVVNNGPSVTETGGVQSTSGTAANANSYYCPTGSPTSWTWGTAYTSNTTSCTGGGTAGQFVTVTASYSFTPFFPGYGFVTNGTITAGAMVQTQ
jgi:Flp pilus assembly protein TadG